MRCKWCYQEYIPESENPKRKICNICVQLLTAALDARKKWQELAKILMDRKKLVIG